MTIKPIARHTGNQLFQACIVLSSLTLLAGCGGSDDNAADDTRETQQATPALNASPMPTPTPAQTATPAPTQSPTPVPTATTTPAPIPSATPVPTPTPETFVVPFRKGEKWTICQGYNTPAFTHKGNEINSLDLSIDASSATGDSGCNLTSKDASAGYKVVAPVAATIAWDGLTLGISSDVVCLSLDATASNNANSILLGHITLDGLTAGQKVTLGQEIGTVNGPSTFNGGYSHIHISMYESATCQGESIPINDVFDGIRNFTSDGSEQQWRGTQIKR